MVVKYKELPLIFIYLYGCLYFRLLSLLSFHFRFVLTRDSQVLRRVLFNFYDVGFMTRKI